jgi:hypothetical protein
VFLPLPGDESAVRQNVDHVTAGGLDEDSFDRHASILHPALPVRRRTLRDLRIRDNDGDNWYVDRLEGLDGVDWASLHGTYGSAEDLPRHIRALSSTDAAVRGDAFAEVSNAVIHQGTRWQVSAYVVPFLAVLIDDLAAPGRPELITLLRQIALGVRADRDLPFSPADAFRRTVTREQEEFVVQHVYHCEQELDDDWGDIADACAEKWDADAYRAAAAHTGDYRRWLGDRDPEVASRAAELLVWFGATEPAIAALLSAGAGADVLASANLALAHAEIAPATIAEPMTSRLHHTDFVVRVTAAIACAYRFGPELPDPALDLLVDAKERDVLPAFPPGWRARAPRGYVALALQRLGLG